MSNANDTYYSDVDQDDWELGATQAQFVEWTDAEDGADGIFRVVDVTAPRQSDFKAVDKAGNQLYEKNEDGTFKLDADGERIEKINYDITVVFEVLSLETDNNPDKFVGQKVRTFFGYTLNNDSKLYNLAKAIVGPEVDDKNFRVRKSTLMDGVVKGTIKVGLPSGEKKIRWPKLTNPRAARGYAASPIDKAAARSPRAKRETINTDEVPF